MTELELYSDKLISALTDTNPLMQLRRIRNNAVMATALAEAHSILTEADKFATKLATTNFVITSATESAVQERLLSYMCLQKLAELYKHTYAYKNGFLTETCTCAHPLDSIAKTKLNNLSRYLHEQIVPLMRAFKTADTRLVRQHIMRKMITALNQVK